MAKGKFYAAYIRLRSLPTGEWLVHEDLRTCLVADAEQRGTNLTEVAIDILAQRYGVAASSSSRKAAPGKDAWELVLRIPLQLKMAIGARANKAGHSLQQEVREALCAHYGLAMPAKRSRGTATSAA